VLMRVENIWHSTTVEKGTWDAKNQLWHVQLSSFGQTIWLSADHVVFAVGGGGQIPTMPHYPGEVSRWRLSGSLADNTRRKYSRAILFILLISAHLHHGRTRRVSW
jgi:hypothetical protein